MAENNCDRESELRNIIQSLKRKEYPAGHLRISVEKANKGETRVKYYHRQSKEDHNGTYISRNNIKLAQHLAQKDYDQKVIRAAEQELKIIERRKMDSLRYTIEDIYESIHPERQKLVAPLKKTDEIYVAEWKAIEYKGKQFDDNAPEHYTAKGERVRSKSEVIIANMLENEGVPYRYEFPLVFDENRSSIKQVYPDFTVLNIRERTEYYWEHFGMMDNPEYAKSAVRKIFTYQQNGMLLGKKLIATFETSNTAINTHVITQIIQEYLK